MKAGKPHWRSRMAALAESLVHGRAWRARARRRLVAPFTQGNGPSWVRAQTLFGDHDTMECTVSWTGGAGTRSGMGFLAETGTGHTLMMDGAPDAAKPENGGQNLAPRPMETLLAGAGGCTAYDVVLILKRGRHDVHRCSCKLTAERAPTDPKVFTAIHMHFDVSGRGIPEAAVERAIAMSHDKYCSATVMLGKTAAITTSFTLKQA
jgi:putative redox protein